MRTFFAPDKASTHRTHDPEPVSTSCVLPPSELARYLSDIESDSECDEAEGRERLGDDGDGEDMEEQRREGGSASPLAPSPMSFPYASATSSSIHAPFPAHSALARKRRKLDIPVRVSIQIKQRERREERERALKDIQKLIKAKKTKFDGGPTGLQSYRARAIASHLNMVVHDHVPSILAARRAAQSQGFSEKWGGRSVGSWVSMWIKTRTLPTSRRGGHGKVYSLLDDPAIKAELRAYVRSRKWSMDPAKLVKFTRGQLVASAADKYLRHIVNEEMPRGLMKYMDINLFPRLQLKVGKGVSLSTARRWLHSEGFRYIGHKKGLYFDGHDRPDVVAYRQDEFLPAMAEHGRRLIRYVVGDVEREEEVAPSNFVERRLVLCAHDEMTAQANDTTAKKWVFENQHELRKKGVGRGIHQSDIICSTVGWLKGASQTLEYGKNYEGYWTGELFVKQVWFLAPVSDLLLYALLFVDLTH